MAIVQIDESGGIFVGKQHSYTKLWLFLAIELVTWKVYIIPMKNQSTKCLLQSLEVLERCRGIMTTLVMDRHASHTALQGKKSQGEVPQVELKCLSPTFRQMLRNGEANLLQRRGVKLIISSGERHQTVGAVEQSMWNLKRLLMNLWPNKPAFLDLFDLVHKVSLVEQYLNTRPTFGLGRNYWSREVFNIATLRRSQTLDTTLFSEVEFPTNRTILQAIQILSQQSRNTLTRLIAELHHKLLNYKNLDLNKVPPAGTCVYLPDKLTKKK